MFSTEVLQAAEKKDRDKINVDKEAIKMFIMFNVFAGGVTSSDALDRYT